MLLIDSAMANTIVLLLLLLVITSDGSNQFATNSSRPRAAGYRTFVQGPNFAKYIQDIFGYGMTNALDFNPVLLGGNRGLAGISVRLNTRGFQYLSALAANIISQQIGRAQIPDIKQCLPQVNGCVFVYNIYISYYRCPRKVAIYPTPNNRIRFSITNFELRIMGRLGGQVNVLLPLGLFGILCMDADQISLDVELAIMRNNMGGVYLEVTGCRAYVGFVNIYIMNGGIIGFIVNTGFRNMVSAQVRQMIPNRLCSMVPGLINNMINPRLNTLPQLIPFSQISSGIISAIRSSSQIPAYCHSPLCQRMASNQTATSQTPTPQTNTIQQPTASVQQLSNSGVQNFNGRRNIVNRQRYSFARRMSANKTATSSRQRNKRAFGDPCAGCPPPSTQSSTLQQVLQALDLRKLYDLALSVQIMGTYATFNDFTINLSGEFSPRGWDGTPFGAFPLYFPYAIGQPMIEAVISDYTINSLLYWMHKRQFIELRISPDTPAFSSLLSTTCGEDYDESDETASNEVRRTVRRKILRLLRRSKRQSIAELEALGVCIGDIAPELAEKYPNRKLFLFVRTARAPSILISARNGGMASIDLIVDVTMYLNGTNTRVGNLRITIVMDIALRLRGNWITGSAKLRVLKITDTEQTLGITQDALDNISNLAKGAIVKALNQALAKGISSPLSSIRLPVYTYNVQVGTIDHGLYFGADINAPSSIFGGFSPGPGIVLCQ